MEVCLEVEGEDKKHAATLGPYLWSLLCFQQAEKT